MLEDTCEKIKAKIGEIIDANQIEWLLKFPDESTLSEVRREELAVIQVFLEQSDHLPYPLIVYDFVYEDDPEEVGEIVLPGLYLGFLCPTKEFEKVYPRIAESMSIKITEADCWNASLMTTPVRLEPGIVGTDDGIIIPVYMGEAPDRIVRIFAEAEERSKD